MEADSRLSHATTQLHVFTSDSAEKHQTHPSDRKENRKVKKSAKVTENRIIVNSGPVQCHIFL